MKLISILWSFISSDRRPEREKARELEFIRAANSLKTLSVTDRGGMSIDPEEIRDQVVASREQLKHLVRKPGVPSSSLNVATDTEVDQEVNLHIEASVEALHCIEIVAWRRLLTGAAVRYVCLQSTSTGRFAVATASLLSEGAESLPPWADVNITRQVASALQLVELRWFTTVSEAMNAWDAEL